jgi:hypothetical protein
MGEGKNPKLRKNGGGGTFMGNVLRTIVDISPELVDLVGTFVPGVSSFSAIAHKIAGDEITPQGNKDLILAAIQKDIAIEEEITRRWVSDNEQEHWLPRLIRPLVVANFTLLIDVVIISSMIGKPLGEVYLPILMTMGVTAIGGYFTVREVGKTNKLKHK